MITHEENRLCAVCGKPLSRKQKTCCSRSCSATLGNRNATRKKARAWKNGKSLNSAGYVRLYIPNHPCSCSAGYVYEHRWIIEQNLGRYLKPWEVVHHINGIKDDNRLENLILLGSQKEHCFIHNRQRKVG